MSALRAQRGFTYLGLVILVAIIGLVAVSSLQVGAIVQRRQAEEELLAIGREYYDALNRYSDATPAGQSPYPGRLEDLLVDPRFPNIRHHLRRLYIDPITGNNEWGVVFGKTTAGQGIIGIHSLSDAPTIKKDNFNSPFEYLKDKKIYSEWVFTSSMQIDGGTGAPTAPDTAGPPRPKPPKLPAAPLSAPGTPPVAIPPALPQGAPASAGNAQN